MTAKGTNNSWITRKLGDMFHIPPFPTEIVDQVTPVVVGNPSFYPVITSDQKRGYLKFIPISVTTTGAGFDTKTIYVPDGHFYRIIAWVWAQDSGSVTLSNLQLHLGNEMGTEIPLLYTTSTSGNQFINFPMDLDLPEVWSLRWTVTISVEVTPAVFTITFIVQDWTTEDQKTIMREGLY